MAVVPYEQRSYPGAAADTTLAAGITSAALSFTVATGDGIHYPDGSGGPFWVVIDYDVATTEKLHCTSRSGDLFTVDTRGADGTTAQAHSLGAKVRACWTATDAQEANRAATNTVGKVTTKGDLLVGTGANAMARQAVGTDGQVPFADSTQTTGVKYNAAVVYVNHGSTGATTRPAGAQVVLWEGTATPANGATNDLWWDITNVLLKRYTGSAWAATGSTSTGAWTAWTPVITGTGSNPTYTNIDSRYLLNGKTLKLQLNVAFTAAGTGTYSLTLPAGATSARSPEGLTPVASSTATSVIGWSTTAGSTSIGFINLSNNLNFGTGLTLAGNSLWLNADIEVT